MAFAETHFVLIVRRLAEVISKRPLHHEALAPATASRATAPTTAHSTAPVIAPKCRRDALRARSAPRRGVVAPPATHSAPLFDGANVLATKCAKRVLPAEVRDARPGGKIGAFGQCAWHFNAKGRVCDLAYYPRLFDCYTKHKHPLFI